MSKRQRGTGGVECTGTLWRFYSPDGAGGTFRSPSIYASEPAALEALAKFRLSVANRQLVHVKGQTLTEYFENHWWPRRLRLKADSTNAADKSRWDARVSRAPFAHFPLGILSRRHIQDWIDGLRLDRPDKPLAFLHNILEGAVRDEVLTSNPATPVEVEVAEGDPDERYPTPEEQRAILTCEAIPRDARLLFAFALGTGLRPGEWRSLKLADLHLDARVPFVFVRYGSVGRVRDGAKAGRTKTRSNRKVPLLDLALVAARLWAADLPTYAPSNPYGLLFPLSSGAHRLASAPFGRVPRSQDKSRHHVWHDYVATAGIARTLVPYSFRHGAATNRLTADTPAWQVQTMLGHARLATTQNYLHHGERELFAALSHSTVTPAGTEGAAIDVPVLQAFMQSVDPSGSCAAFPSTTAPEASAQPPRPEINLQWSELASGTREQALAALMPVLLARRESDPIERAFARLQTEHWKAALAELIELLTTPNAIQKAGVR